MRRLALTTAPLVLLAACSNPPTTSTVLNDDAAPPAFKADRQESTWEAVMDEEPAYEDCATGEDMQNHGRLLVYETETTLPSGNVILHGWVDYAAFGPVTLEGVTSGDIWTLQNGHNPFGDVSKENGFYMLRYQWSELYKNPDGQTLHIHLKGHFKIDPDGNVTIDRESYTCR